MVFIVKVFHKNPADLEEVQTEITRTFITYVIPQKLSYFALDWMSPTNYSNITIMRMQPN